MLRRHHLLKTDSPGTLRHLDSLHFGAGKSGKKAHLQAGLHADEPPGLLVLYHLVELLTAAEARGSINGEIVVVPLANPIGLSQGLLYQPMGRFELNSAENFNRNYPDLNALVTEDVIAKLGDDPIANVAIVRAAIGAALKESMPKTELEAMRLALITLAHDADIVLDIHCDNQAVMHLYTETPYWRQAEPLARYLGARVTLLAEGSGTAAGGAFDEALSGLWWRLPRKCAALGTTIPALPLACFAATVELRGEADVSHELAKQDASMLYAYLSAVGLIDETAPDMPPLLGEPTPLAGSVPFVAPHGGIVTFLCDVGSEVEEGTPIADVLDPVALRITTVLAPVAGCFYARMALRTARTHQSLGRIAGREPLRAGPLLTP
jgi:uncharacterized protein